MGQVPNGLERTRRARRAALVIAAVLVVAGAWILVPDPPLSSAVDDELRVASSGSTEPTVELAAADTAAHPRLVEEPAASARSAATSISVENDTRAPVAIAKARRTMPARLVVRAVDAVTREELDRVRVRAASADRIADRTVGPGQTEVSLSLTPGAYSPLVLVPGYEPVELDVVRVDAGTEVGLTAELRRGRASIVGLAIGSALVKHAELTGSGRHPCDRCAELGDSTGAGGQRDVRRADGWNRTTPCTHCGFAAAFTRVPVGLGGTFEFVGLGSGTYALRLTDDRGHGDGAPLLAVLSEAERLRVELSAPMLRDVLVDVIDVDGLSLGAAWGANVRDLASNDETDVVSFEGDAVARELVWRFAVFEGTEFFGRGEFSTPTRAGISIGRVVAFGGRKFGTSGRDDRGRRAGEELRPPAEVPKFPEVILASNVRADGLVQIEGVPARELTIRLTCEPFLVTVTVPDSMATTTVGARLERMADGTTDPATFRALDAARYR